MATVKVKFRPSSAPGAEGMLYFRILHRRLSRQLRSGYRLRSDEWDPRLGKVRLPDRADDPRHHYLRSLQESLCFDTTRLQEVIRQLDRTSGSYTVDDVVSHYLSDPESPGFVAFTRQLIGQMEQVGKLRTAERYGTVLNSFIRFHGPHDVALDAVDSALMLRYEEHLKRRGLCPNSSSFYMRGLRAIYNRAVDHELTLQRYPFKHVYTGIDKTVKRGVSLQVIRRIRDLDLGEQPAADLARDLFMFSFYTRGMSFIDMAYLKKSDLSNGILSYRRQKTGQKLFIKWEKPMQAIVDKYGPGSTPYLLPIIRQTGTDDRRQYKNAAHLVNGHLRQLGERLGLPVPLTTYVARHGWATIAKSQHVPLSTISEAMGHDSEKTTRIYLAALDTSAVDKANRRILEAL